MNLALIFAPRCRAGKPAQLWRNVACTDCIPPLIGAIVTPKRVHSVSLMFGFAWELEESIACPAHGLPITWLLDADLKPLPDLSDAERDLIETEVEIERLRAAENAAGEVC